MSNTQSYKTHRRLVPAFHIGVLCPTASPAARSWD
jgi:hypothetical protein